MVNSVNTNAGALIALQNLNATNTELAEVQNRINTGKRINNAKDNGATWAIAQNMRGKSSALDAVKESLSRAQSTIDVAMSAGSQVSDLLTQMKQKALSASDTSLDTTSRAALNEDFKALRDQIAKVVSNASFNGINMIKSGGTNVYALANDDGSSKLTVQAQSLSLVGIGLTATSSFTSATAASTLVATLTTALTGVSTKLTKLGTGSKALDSHLEFIGKLQDSLDAGVGNLVDADLAKESARLQALQPCRSRTRLRRACAACSVKERGGGLRPPAFSSSPRRPDGRQPFDPSRRPKGERPLGYG
jgi:flagellin